MADVMSAFIKHTQIYLPKDVSAKLSELRMAEDNPLAMQIYDVMFKNLELAAELKRPICQDTGFMQFFINCGSEFPLIGAVERVLIDAVEKATEETPLRPNTVETFSEHNTGNNIGSGAPAVMWKIIPGRDDCEIYTYPAGGGSSLPGSATVLMPSQGYEGATEFVLERIWKMGPNACPPLVVGVGIANTSESAAVNAKHALLRQIGRRSDNISAAAMEEELERKLNESGIGPQGMGGRNTVMGVSVVNTARHPATMGVAVATGCWVHRRGMIRFDRNLNYISDTHPAFNVSGT